MKLTNVILIGFFLCAWSTLSQDLDEKINNLNTKIASTEKGERLQWMDSLVKTIEFNIQKNYDSISKATIAYAIELDSMEIATDRISDLIYFYYSYNLGAEKSIELYKNSLYLKPRMFPDDLSRFFLNTSNVYQYIANYDEALKLIDSALVYAEKAKSQRLEGFGKLYKGQIYASKGKYAEASKIYQEAAQIFAEEKDTFYILSVKNSLSILYSQNSFFEEAEAIRTPSIDMAKEASEYGYLASLYSNRATDLSKQNRLKESIESMKLAIEAMSKTNYSDNYSAPLIAELAAKYIAADSLAKAKKLVDTLQNNRKLIANGYNLWMYNYALRQYEFATGNYQQALALGIQTLQENKSQFQVEELINSEKFVSEVYHEMADYERENYHLKNFMRLNDSVNSVKKTNALSYYQTLYETEIRDHTIENQRKNMDLLEQKNQRKNQAIVLGIIGMLLLFGLVFAVRSRNNFKKQEVLQADYSKKLLLAQEMERTRVAKDLHDSVGQKLSMLVRKAKNKDQGEFAIMGADVLEEVRTISRGLYPPMLEKLGLTKSISHLLLEIDEETEMFVSSEIDTIDSFFDEEETATFYRFIQESISNVIKHANAKTLMVKITIKNNQLDAIIKDNGKGFSEVNNLKESLGLKTMAERIKMLKGNFTIDSTTKRGTVITATINK